MRTALVTGVLGQDGSLLSELLLQKGYRVAGFELTVPERSPEGVELFTGDVTDKAKVEAVISAVQPDEIYHLAGQTSVGRSFEQPRETFESVAGGTLNVLDAVRRTAPRARVLVASSGEIFGDTGGQRADETTPLRPLSPYGSAKAAAAHVTTTYRSAFGTFACLAFFYNHESPRRPPQFVTRKVVRAACRIARGLDRDVELGDTAVVRDWGWAAEYVEAAWRMLQQPNPEDFVIATGQSCSLEEFVELTFESVGLSAAAHVKRSAALRRAAEIPSMTANPARANERLGWRAQVRVAEVVKRLVAAEFARLDGEQNERK